MIVGTCITPGTWYNVGIHFAGYKLTPASAQKRFPLLMPTLDGLTKYAHLISVEYFADLIQVCQFTCVLLLACACVTAIARLTDLAYNMLWIILQCGVHR